jgi:hypothetical protein
MGVLRHPLKALRSLPHNLQIQVKIVVHVFFNIIFVVVGVAMHEATDSEDLKEVLVAAMCITTGVGMHSLLGLSINFS